MDEELYELLKQKRKVEAIKYIGNKYEMDYKTSKDTVDRLIEKLDYFEGELMNNNTNINNDFSTSEISDDDLYLLIKENKKIEAVKYIRDKYNFDLKTSKNIVDSLDVESPMMFTEKSIIPTSNSNSSNFESGYSIGNYSYKMIDGEQLYYTYKDGEKKEVNRVSIPKDILKDFEKSADEYEDKRIKRKNILLGILLVIIIAGILIYFN